MKNKVVKKLTAIVIAIALVLGIAPGMNFGLTAYAAAGTVTFTNNTGMNDYIASDGEGGSTGIDGIEIQAYGIDSSGAVLTNGGTLNFQNLDPSWGVVPPMITFDPVEPLLTTGTYGMAIKSADGSNFKLSSLNFNDWGNCDGHSFTIDAYDGMAKKGSATFFGNVNYTDYVAINSSILNLSFNNIDEVRIHNTDGSGSWFGINDIEIDNPVVPTLTYDAGAFTETAANDGTITTTKTVTLSGGETFVAGPFAAGTHYTVANVPTGLTMSVVRTSPTHATISLTGTATAHANNNDISNLAINFSNVAFVGNDATKVVGATKNDMAINFADAPTITSATYDAGTGVIVATGANMTAGDTLAVNKLTITGEGGTNYTLTTRNVIANNATDFSVTLNASDKAAVNMILNKNDTSSTSGTTFNLAAADDWDNSVTVGDSSDATNPITVSNVAIPTITSATYDASTGTLVITGTSFFKLAGANNDIVISKLTITGDGTAYTLTDTANVEIISGTNFTVTLSATDRSEVNQRINKNGNSSIGSTNYNLAAAEDWAAGADATVVVADINGNSITASNVFTAPTVSTTIVSSIIATGATVTGNVSEDGGKAVSEKGIVYSTASSPTIASSVVTDGTGTGTISVNLTGLTPGTKYYVRAYATNSVGISYGSEVNFTTSKLDPIVTAWPTVSDITYEQNFEAAIAGGSANVAGSFSIQDATTVPDVAGSPYTKILTFTPINTTTYNSVSNSVEITVNKATAVISEIICADKTYNGSALAPSSTITTGTGTIAYTYSGTGITGSTSTAPTNVGSYTVTATLVASSNYNAESKTKNVTISTANQSGFTITGKPTNPVYGDTFTLGTTGGSGTGSGVTWSVIGCAEVTSGGVVNVTGAGSVNIIAIKAGDNNYNQATDTYTFTAGKATPTIGTVTSSDIYVGDTLSDSSLSRTDSSVVGTLSWEANSSFSSLTSGIKTATYAFNTSGTDSDIYNNLTGQNATVEVKTRKILSVEAQAPITDKIYGTIQGNLSLPANVNVTAQGVNGDVTRAVPVTWSGYSTNTLTAQTLTGTLDLSGNELVNTDNLSVAISVTLQPLVAKNIDNVSAKIKVGATDGTDILKALVTNQFDASVDTTATNATNWAGFPANYNTTTSDIQAITVRVNFVAGCTPTYKDVTINYEIVNPSALAYANQTVTAIAAIDANNATANALLAYVNGQNAITATWPVGTIGSSIVANSAPTYATLPKTYVQTGTTYDFSQSYLGHTLSQSVTVNEVQQAQPILSIDYGSEQINTTTAMSYSEVSGVWIPCTANMSITPWIDQTVNFKTAAAGFKVDSDDTTVVFSAREAAPVNLNATINDSKTEISFSGLAVGTAYEYSTDGLTYLDLSADGKLTVVGYQNSVNIRKKFVTGVSVHSVVATVDVKYAMIFNSTSGSAISTAYAVSGADVSAPSSPTRSGYTFSGWNSAEDGIGSAITFPYTMTGNITVYARWTVYTAPPSGNNTPSTQTPQPVKGDFEVVINGEKQEPAGTATEVKLGDHSQTIITFDEKKLDAILEKIVVPVNEQEKPVITVPVTGNSDIVTSQLNGQNIKDMENKEIVLEIKTQTATYSLPAQQINIDAILSQIGKAVELKDIKVQIEISKSTADTVKVVESAAKKGEFTIVASPVDFTVTCTYENKTVEINSFNAYVERTVAIPEGIDPSKITTGIVVDPDGTVRHVPTKIVLVNGKYFAKINSLTNSTYSVVWHPLEFKDVNEHWAKDAINDMGSRLVISGVGNDLFAPDKDITRAEFAAIIVNALGLKPGMGSNPFSDVRNTDWYCEYIQTAYEYGIIAGVGKGKFGPMDKITHEQAMTMIAKAMKIAGLKVDFKTDEAKKLLAAFGDSGKSSAWAKDSIATCVTAGILPSNMSKTLAPKVNITRAEVADIVRKLLQKSNLI